MAYNALDSAMLLATSVLGEVGVGACSFCSFSMNCRETLEMHSTRTSPVLLLLYMLHSGAWYTYMSRMRSLC
jgi:hypothetical protein